jgi:hypothetical protein
MSRFSLDNPTNQTYRAQRHPEMEDEEIARFKRSKELIKEAEELIEKSQAVIDQSQRVKKLAEVSYATGQEAHSLFSRKLCEL